MTPVVDVVLGILVLVLVLGETIHWNQPAGGVPVILGILISQGRLTPRRPDRSARHDADRRPQRTGP
ncbi:hypothetical protein ACIBQ1_46875 [Nonomuraea sp. NPDC050153]|uniref:hypothetical protein n=1 Tax=Nonomuraea sp. NPDC050153 TaxID=3364359 RepID=UPI0037A88EA1